jgi:gliding motility-associated-like protein
VKTAFFTCLMLISVWGWSQRFPVTGQLPSTAFPVCGTAVFTQATVPLGSPGNIAVPGCDIYNIANPFWYSFTCYSGGTLGFLITPNNLNDDYDWMLFDITGHSPNDVYTDSSLVVAGNWSGSYGLTGARNGGNPKISCGSDPVTQHVTTYSTMPNLEEGHTYLLLISHYTNTQSGYQLNFGGGSAVITDTLLPKFKSATPGCDGKSLTLILNKQMRCNSLAPDGSDFIIGGNPVSITGASGLNCNNGFDMDTIIISMNNPLPIGNYSLLARTGGDGNTLLDDCGTQVAVGENIAFMVLPPHPTPMDSLTPPACAPNSVQLVFPDLIQCSSIAPDGSDFVVSGSSAVGISKVAGICSNGLTHIINITFSNPIKLGGSYQVTLVNGSDGNTIINECGVETPANSAISFSLKDTVSAAFNYNINYGCKNDTLNLIYQPAIGVNQWQWTIDNVFTSSLLDTSIIYSVFGPKNVQHFVSNGFCSDVVTEPVNLDNVLKAAFKAPDQVCPKDLVTFNDTSVGNIRSWYWNFDDGTSSMDQTPAAHLFPNTGRENIYSVSLVVENNLGCYDTAIAKISKLLSCYITVPNAFTPNGDGKNDWLYPLNAYMATNLEFMVFNRYGQLVFETRDWTHKWDGKINGISQGTGTYIWTLRYTDGPSGKKFFLRGSSVLIR